MEVMEMDGGVAAAEDHYGAEAKAGGIDDAGDAEATMMRAQVRLLLKPMHEPRRRVWDSKQPCKCLSFTKPNPPVGIKLPPPHFSHMQTRH